jgi:hypothetical protein
MQRERQAILSLVALGRITPRDAERMLAAWNAGREELWAIAIGAAACLAHSLPALGRLVHSLLPGGLPGLLHAAAAVLASAAMYWMGGVL